MESSPHSAGHWRHFISSSLANGSVQAKREQDSSSRQVKPRNVPAFAVSNGSQVMSVEQRLDFKFSLPEL